MKRITLSLIGAVFLAPVTAEAAPLINYSFHSAGHYQTISVSEDTQAKAKDFVANMVDRGLGFLSDDSITKDQQVKQFTTLLETSFDMRTIARFALARYWRTATPAQRDEYLKLFEDMVVEVYSRRFGEYDGQKVDVRSARAEGRSDVVVSSYVIPDSGPQIQVDWRLRYKNNQFKVIDVFVEGVSMALTQRSDFASVIQRGGGDIEILLSHLRQE